MPQEQVRVPDVSFVSSERLKLAQLKREPILTVVPDLGIEVVGRGNTKREMERKLNDYFDAGIRLVWYIYPRKREIHVFRSPNDCRVLTEIDVLDGGNVLPGFTLPLKRFFGEFEDKTEPAG
jgi:Uma2 family endonuclease